MTTTGKAALLLVDVQNDFCPGGALGVTDGDRVVEPLNRIASCFAAAGLPVVATRDWHPAITCHFMEHGGAWPPHCIQGSSGAAFHPALQLPDTAVVISKGTRPDSDAYSAFDGHSEAGTPLIEILSALAVRTLYLGGLATDYCVRSSTLDAVKAGYTVIVLMDAVAGVDVRQGDSERAVAEMRSAGASFCTTEEAIRQICEKP